MGPRNILSICVSVLLFNAILLSATTEDAYAYVDFGSAGFFVQMAIASAFTAAFTVKFFWQKLNAKFSLFFSKVKRVRQIFW